MRLLKFLIYSQYGLACKYGIHYLTTFFGVRNIGHTSAIKVIFFSKMI